MKTTTTLGVVIMITLVATIGATPILLQQQSEALAEGHEMSRLAKAPIHNREPRVRQRGGQTRLEMTKYSLEHPIVKDKISEIKST